MNLKWRVPSLVVLSALALLLVASSGSARPSSPNRPTDRTAIYTAGAFTFGNTQELLQTGPAPLTGFSLEPEIKADVHGNVYVTAMEGVPGGVDLWKSKDLGGTFTYLGQPDGAQCPAPPTCVNGAGLGGGDDSIDVSNGGYLYVSSLWLGSTTVSVSKDGGAGGVLPGQAWEVNPIAGQPPALDRQWIAAYGPQTLYQSYTEIATGTVFVEKSTDAGKTFGAPVPVYPVVNPPVESFRMGNIVVDQFNGNVYLSFVADNTLGHTRAEVWFAKSTDGGATWTLTKAYQGPAGTNAAHSFPITAVDRGGNPHIGFARCDVGAGTAAPRSNCQIWLVSSSDAGATWLDAVRVSNGAQTQSAVFPWIVAGSPGVVDVTWYGASSATPDDNAAQWHLFFTQTRDALAATPTFAQVQAISQTIHDSSICFRGLDCDLPTNPGNRDLAEYFSMAIDPDGNANIAFSDTVNNCGAGCITNTWYTKQTAGPAGYSPPAAPAAATFTGNFALPQGGGAEPSIWVDDHSCIYATAPGGPKFWKSENNGASFSNPVNPVSDEATLTGGDEDVITIPKQDGTRSEKLYFTDLGLSSDHIRKSTDRGVTWSKPGTGGASGDTAFSSDRQWLAGERNGPDETVYQLDHELVSEVMRISKMTNEGPWVTFSGQTDPELTTTVPNTNPGPLFFDKANRVLYGVFNASIPTTNAFDPPFGKLLNIWDLIGTMDNTVFVNKPVYKGVIDSIATTPAAAQTFGTNNASIFPAGDVDASGNVYAVWSMNSSRTNEFAIWMASSHDGGQNFYGPFRVSQGPGTAVLPWVAAGSQGRIDITWYQTSTVGDPNELPPAAAWNVMFAHSQNARSREPVFTVSQVSNHVIHHGQVSTGGLIGSADRTLLDYFEVDTDPAGLAHIVYADDHSSPGTAIVYYAKQGSGPGVLTNPIQTTCTGAPTAVTRVSLSAKSGRKIRVAWRTPWALDALGFNVWRSARGSYARVNRKLIPATSLSRLPGRYEYVDRAVRAGTTYSYKLEIHTLDGTRRWVGPVRATARR